MAEPLWRPTPEAAAGTRMEGFRLAASRLGAAPCDDYDALHAWSVAQPESFWRLAASWCGLPLRGDAPRARSEDPMPLTRWFDGATLSYAEALLYPRDLHSAAAPALIAAVESGHEEVVSFAALRARVAAVQAALTASGIGHGDSVVALAANVPATVELLLACAGLGVRLATCSPDFGAAAALARFGQLAPKALFASCGYRYAGRWHDTRDTVGSLARSLAGLHEGLTLVALPYPGEGEPVVAGASPWSRWLDAAGAAGDRPTLLQLPFDEPLSVLFSSGTTGPPKALVHRAGGTLLTHAKEHALHCDVRAGDVVFYYSTCGWMMWNWLVSSLAQGATALLYDGSPAYPDSTALFALAERHGVTFFGTSARSIHSLMAAGVHPAVSFDLSAVRTVASTGSPLSPAGFRYVYERVAAHVHLASISGGTDIVGCFMLGVPTLPVYAGEIQRPGLGVDLAVYDEQGAPLARGAGELVCRQPLPSMPLGFLGDGEHVRYRAAYLDRYPGVWHHGDTIAFTEHGGIVVHGRSDATLNPGGVRIGTAEVYRALEAVPEIVEAAAVGRKVPAAGAETAPGVDEEVWLFVVLRDGVVLDTDLRGRIVDAVRSGASPRHAPRAVLAVADLPRTRSGKLMELVVARILNAGGPAAASAAAREASGGVANPEALASVAAVVALALGWHGGEAGRHEA